MKESKIAVLIPCYNESKTVAKVIKDYKKALPEADIYVYDNNLGIYLDSKTNENINSIIVKGEARDLPLFGMQWSIGLCVWTIAILAVCFIRKNKFIAITPFLPCITIWITMLLASPVWGEFRYVYGLFTSLPFLIGLFFIKSKTID